MSKEDKDIFIRAVEQDLNYLFDTNTVKVTKVSHGSFCAAFFIGKAITWCVGKAVDYGMEKYASDSVKEKYHSYKKWSNRGKKLIDFLTGDWTSMIDFD
eukprot:CAMPEP_0197056000 /NCGR_PEP_ID=MMETSP1384-20130603/77149_1 /TAXON_ID=29189 /ORGANISM="Ammonia sp." /LENGTH=98 /DNA_ID=CAMNT_0042489811 /DNA_START=27 /DNA_END=323 /DNA_ORIENTATION=+